MCLFPVDLQGLREIVGPETAIHYDASHTLGLIAGGAWQQPLAEGADTLGGSTHKTYPGPHKGLLATNDAGLRGRHRLGEDPPPARTFRPRRRPAHARYQLMDAAGLQRARLTGIGLRAEDLIDAGQVAEQISLDGARQSRLVAEQVMDRIRDKFGPASIGPAAVVPFRRAS